MMTDSTETPHFLNDTVPVRGLFCHSESSCERSQSAGNTHSQSTFVKKRSGGVENLIDLPSHKAMKMSLSSFALVQEALLGTLVAPFLTDRRTFNNFACASREVHEVCKSLPAPWPRQILSLKAVAQSLSFSPCGQLLACCSATCIHIWNRETGSKRIIRTSAQVTSISFSLDGKYLASGHRSNTSSDEDFVLRDNIDVCAVRLWDVQTLQCTNILRGDQHGGMFTIAFSPDSRIIATGGADQLIRLWNLHDGSCLNTLYGHASWIYSLKFSPDGKYLASAGEEETAVLLWNLENLEVIALEGHTESVHCVAFSPDGSFLVSGSDDETICIWDLHHNLTCTVLEGNLCSVWTIACSPDSKTIVSGGRDMQGNQVIRIWSVEKHRSVSVIRGHTDYITSLAFSPSGRTLASASFDCTVRTWNMATENAICKALENTEKPGPMSIQ